MRSEFTPPEPSPLMGKAGMGGRVIGGIFVVRST
jgi:hypothetical protein